MIEKKKEESPKRLLSTEACVCQDGRIINTRTHKWEPCPYCERAYKWMKMSERPVEDEYNNVYELLGIPMKYRNLSLCGREFLLFDNYEKWWSDKKYRVETVKNVAELIFAISDSVYAGRVFKQSVCVFVPLDDTIPDIKKWIYSCIEHGANNGLNVVPYLSLSDLYALRELELYDDKEIAKVSAKKGAKAHMANATQRKISALIDLSDKVHFSYYDFVSADMLFVEVIDDNDVYVSFLADLLASRAALDKPTYVISRKKFRPANHFLATEKGDLSRLSDYIISFAYKEAVMGVEKERKTGVKSNSSVSKPINEIPDAFKSNSTTSGIGPRSGFVESVGKGALLGDN